MCDDLLELFNRKLASQTLAFIERVDKEVIDATNSHIPEVMEVRNLRAEQRIQLDKLKKEVSNE